ncbi:MAG: HAMP domain-containing sensor histidine kinase [Candidatus Nealsonbacteria bacterium]
MMSFKEILEQLNIRATCKRYGLGMWRCPQFLFLLMGLVIITTSLITYFLGTRYVADPGTVSLIVLILTVILFVITFSITKSLEGLAEANRLKSEFISIISHQLRSPLSSLKWALEILISGRFGKIDGKPAEYLQILSDNTKRMGELISSLLIVSRIEQGRLPLHKAKFSLSNLAKEAIAEFAPIASASNIEIVLETANPSAPDAFGDSSQLKLVVENFIDNAVRYTKGSGKVIVCIAPENGKLLFSCKDGGVGIPKEDEKHIFQKFFRSSNVLKYQTQGSGLGLYIAKSIVEKSGGKIGFKSEHGKGSTFWFTIPTKK